MSDSYSFHGDQWLDWIGEDTSEKIVHLSGSIVRFNIHSFAVIEGDHISVEVSIDDKHWFPVALELISEPDITYSRMLNSGQLGVLRGKFRRIRVEQHGLSQVTGAHGFI